MVATAPKPPRRLPIVTGERLTLRPGEPDDAAALTELLASPDVMAFWGSNPLERVREELSTLETWVIDVGGSVAGWLQVSEETEPESRHVGFDIAVATAFQGQGLGREALQTAMRHFASEGHHRFTIDPRADNERAVRSYAGVGFKPIGVARQAERDDDGRWHDALEMDALSAELDWL